MTATIWKTGQELLIALNGYVEKKNELLNPEKWHEAHQKLAELQQKALAQLEQIPPDQLGKWESDGLMDEIARASVLLSRESMEGALELTSFLLEVFPQNAKLLFTHAKLCRLLNDLNSAVDALEQALSIAPSLELLHELYTLLMQRGSYNTAEQLRLFYTKQYDEGKDTIDKSGSWQGEDALFEHLFDGRLALALLKFFEQKKALTIVDFGCGTGDFVALLLANNAFAEGYDGNPKTPELSWGLAKVQNLAVPFDLGKKFDWVMCLEVAEHIPKEYEGVFVENLIRHCKQGIVLSWAVKNQGGHGHFNEQDNDYVRELLAKHGFKSDVKAELELRAQTSLPWFKNSLMVFIRSSVI